MPADEHKVEIGLKEEDRWLAPRPTEVRERLDDGLRPALGEVQDVAHEPRVAHDPTPSRHGARDPSPSQRPNEIEIAEDDGDRIG
jgi:hypothetical protein